MCALVRLLHCCRRITANRTLHTAPKLLTQVPILRNRRRALLFVESPWDSFGPVPPMGSDYGSSDLDTDQ